MMLQPSDPFTGGLSGVFRLGYEPRPTSPGIFQRLPFLEGGPGKTWRFLRDIDVYLLGLIGAIGGDLPSMLATARCGSTIRELWGMKTVLSAEWIHVDRSSPLLGLSLSQVWNRRKYSWIVDYNRFQSDHGSHPPAEILQLLLRLHF